MPKAWTGKLLAKMHIHGIKQVELAARYGCTQAYMSMLLKSEREPTGTKEKLTRIVNEIIDERKKDGEKK